MASFETCANGVQCAVASLTTTTATVNTVRNLLTPDAETLDSRRNIVVSCELVSNASAKRRGPKGKEDRWLKAPDDDHLRKQRHAFATDICNSALKALGEILKTHPRGLSCNECSKLPDQSPENVEKSDRTRPKSRPIARAALKPRSNNIGTSSQPYQNGSKAPPELLSSHDCRFATVIATAGCARLAIDFLRSMKPHQQGRYDVADPQISNASFALATYLAKLGQTSQAFEEMRSLHSHLWLKADMKETGFRPQRKSATQGVSMKEISDLFDIHVEADASTDELQFAIRCQTLCMKLLASATDLSILNDAIAYISIENPCSPANLMQRQASLPGLRDRSVQQLQSTSQLLLGLFPLSEPKETTSSLKCGVDPSVKFRTQAVALEMRKMWWDLAGHRADYGRELVHPFNKCLAAFYREAHTKTTNMHEVAKKAFSSISLGVPQGISGWFDTYWTLSMLSQLCSEERQSGHWLKRMLEDVRELPSNHARKILCELKTVSKPTGAHEGKGRQIPDDDLKIIAEALNEKITGSASDFDYLLVELAQFVRNLSITSHSYTDPRCYKSVFKLAGGFAQRYSRSCKDKNVSLVRGILTAAVDSGHTSSEMASWLTVDALQAFATCDFTRGMALKASSSSTDLCWSSSTTAMVLDRILNGLAAKCLLTGTTYHVEMQQIFATSADAVPGIVLERYLEWMETLLTQSKYRQNLGKIIPGLSQDLSKMYTIQRYPIRRARTYVSLLRMRQMEDGCPWTEILRDWQDDIPLDRNSLEKDSGLSDYLVDVDASLRLAKAFDQGNPPLYILNECLVAWESLDLAQTCDKTRTQQVGNSDRLRMQLAATTTYLAALGENNLHLSFLRLLESLVRDSISNRLDALIDIAEHYVASFQMSQASSTIAAASQLLGTGGITRLSILRFSLARSNYLDAAGQHEEARIVLESSFRMFEQASREITAKDQRRLLHRLVARAWHIVAKIYLHSGLPHEAIAAGKHSVKILNSIWSTFETCRCGHSRTTKDKNTSLDETSVLEITAAVRRLDLATPRGSCTCKGGATYWSLIPPLNEALLSLSDLYAHHGVYHDANYYSEQALRVLESFGLCPRLSATRIHRARFLLRAKRIEDAELCISGLSHQDIEKDSLLQIGLGLVEAGIFLAEDSPLEALSKIDDLGVAVGSDSGKGNPSKAMDDEMDRQAIMGKRPKRNATEIKSRSARSNVASVANSRSRAAGKATSVLKDSLNLSRKNISEGDKGSKPIVHDDIVAMSLLRISLLFRLDKNPEAALKELDTQSIGVFGHLQSKTLSFHALMKQAKHILEMDVSLNVLLESTLAMPTFRVQGPSRTKSALATSARPSSRRTANSKLSHPKDALVTVLSEARETIQGNEQLHWQYSSTAMSHQQPAMCIQAALLTRAIHNSHPQTDLATEGSLLESARSRAMIFQRHATNLETSIPPSLEWPSCAAVQPPNAKIADCFQAEYLDIMPQSWVALSLTLNNEGTELYLARYQNGASPFIVRLPFSRHKPALGDEIDEDEDLTFENAQAELEDIITRSNLSCHGNGDIHGKGFRNKWWNERQDLDRRLHQLVRNMQEFWFGGFCSLFSTNRPNANVMSSFGKMLEDILHRHLPSRTKSKSHHPESIWQDHVLQLFINLGMNMNTKDDLDEPLADLLYFIVDTLQFTGEHNAYDEIDFDSMIVEVADAIRSCCPDDQPDDPEDDQHLILILDKELQRFPWESLPCLEGVSVSRVDSMASLRECILAMPCMGPADASQKRYTVDRHNGTYILNPSSDLVATQAVLQPALSCIENERGSSWTALVNEIPSEQEFKSKLSSATILMYFGHGAGSQYIRPRTIKRLDTCSEVVWLMGCSSGSVTEHGELEPNSVPLNYLAAGSRSSQPPDSEQHGVPAQPHGSKCMAVLATLWDVTDKDIDRFSLVTGERWGLWPSSSESHLPRKPAKERIQKAEILTPTKAFKTPKTPKVRPKSVQSALPTAAHASQSPHRKDGKMCLSEAVSHARESCYLRYLNGAAPVVYGIPVYLQKRLDVV